MVKLALSILIAITSTAFARLVDRSEFSGNYRANGGYVGKIGDQRVYTSGVFRIHSPDVFGPTGSFHEVQVWTTVETPTVTVAFGARSVGGSCGVWLLACPNAVQSATNQWVNRFEILSAPETNAGTVSSSFTIGSNEWAHFAFSYTPASGTWVWYKNGIRQGSTSVTYQAAIGERAATWTNDWKTNGVLMIQTLRGLPLAGQNPRPEFDCLAVSECAMTDLQIQREALAWRVRRFGVTVDDPFSLSISVAGIPRDVPDTTAISTNSDALVYANTWAETRFDQQISVSVPRGLATWGYAIDGGYSIDPCGLISNTADGGATVTVTATNNGVREFVKAFPFSVVLTNTAQSNVVYKTGLAGSVRASASDWINARVGTGQRSLWTAYSHATTNYARSTNCWAMPLGIESQPVWNSRYNSGGVSGVLVAPDLVLGAGHSYCGPGDVIRWVTLGDVVVSRTVAAATRIDGFDLALMRLASPVTNITFAPLCPTNWASYIPDHPEATYNSGPGYGVPAIKISQTGRVDVLDVVAIGDRISFDRPADTNRAAYYAPIMGGDSGNPAFWVIDGTAVVACTWSSYTMGPFTGSVSNDVFEAAIQRVGSTNSLTRFGFSGFQEYP